MPLPSQQRAAENISEIVLAVITHDEHICLMRRSEHVRGDNGKWHCITGFLDAHHTPLAQALAEVREEAGLSAVDIDLRNTVVLDRLDDRGNRWRIHAFHFESNTRDVRLNWENDASMWARSHHFDVLPTVSWLRFVLRALSDSLPDYAKEPRKTHNKPGAWASSPALNSLSDFAYTPHGDGSTEGECR